MSFVDASATEIDAAAVARLVSRQFPHWADRAVTAGPSDGTGNALFRLGDDLLVRLPLHRGATAAIDLELRWLPRLAAHLPLAIPVPVVAGAPDEVCPRPWAVFRWLNGTGLDSQNDADRADVAVRLGQFVAALRNIDIAGAPASLRVNPLQGDGSDVHDNIHVLSAAGMVDEALALAVWESAVAVSPSRAVWLHGDLFPLNLLTDRGRLSAVIDFDLMGVGDPAIDMLPAWALLTAKTRPLFREASGVDDDAWIRGRGHALSVAVRAARRYRGTGHHLEATAAHMLTQTMTDYRQTL
jgi:aminoglycoside phosphotransferase (APT) family kinase protein